MTTLECLKLFALMASPLVFSLIVGGVWEGIEYRRAETVKDQPDGVWWRLLGARSMTHRKN